MENHLPSLKQEGPPVFGQLWTIVDEASEGKKEWRGEYTRVLAKMATKYINR
jgi:hypothetical protein